jgi:hypothetical protein
MGRYCWDQFSLFLCRWTVLGNRWCNVAGFVVYIMRFWSAWHWVGSKGRLLVSSHRSPSCF